jgi:hypothetical protein
LQIKKLVKDKKADTRISEYLYMEKELGGELVLLPFMLWCPRAGISYPSDIVGSMPVKLMILTKGYDFFDFADCCY